jgi:hypothetical protein
MWITIIGNKSLQEWRFKFKLLFFLFSRSKVQLPGRQVRDRRRAEGSLDPRAQLLRKLGCF